MALMHGALTTWVNMTAEKCHITVTTHSSIIIFEKSHGHNTGSNQNIGKSNAKRRRRYSTSLNTAAQMYGTAWIETVQTTMMLLK